MRKLRLQLTISLTLLGLGATAAHAEWIIQGATRELHRFQVTGPQIGYFLTADKQEGIDLGYTYEGMLPYSTTMILPPMGSLIPTPVRDFTIPIYRYKVTMASGAILLLHPDPRLTGRLRIPEGRRLRVPPG